MLAAVIRTSACKIRLVRPEADTTFGFAAQDRAPARRIVWDDTAPLHARLEAKGLTGTAFPAYVERVRQTNARRVREGDLDHLVFYALQSTHFTKLPPIEPALSAKALVQSLDPAERDGFLRGDGRPRAVRSGACPCAHGGVR